MIAQIFESEKIKYFDDKGQPRPSFGFIFLLI